MIIIIIILVMGAAGARGAGKHTSGCDTYTNAPAQKSYTNFIMYPFVIRKCYTNSLGHGHGYECHSPHMRLAEVSACDHAASRQDRAGSARFLTAQVRAFWKKRSSIGCSWGMIQGILAMPRSPTAQHRVRCPHWWKTRGCQKRHAPHPSPSPIRLTLPL